MQKYLCSLSEEELKQITDLAALFFTPREIALMMELHQEDFVSSCEAPNFYPKVYNAFHSGRLQSEVDLRTRIIKLAKSGSSPAQTMALDLLNKSKLKLIDR